MGKKLRECLREDFFRKKGVLSQSDLAKLSGLTQSTISSIENNRVNLGVERAKALARALGVHPAVLVFPDWDQSVA
jgi:transcriptional regulator with XRE-family HTH domain